MRKKKREGKEESTERKARRGKSEGEGRAGKCFSFSFAFLSLCSSLLGKLATSMAVFALCRVLFARFAKLANRWPVRRGVFCRLA